MKSIQQYKYDHGKMSPVHNGYAYSSKTGFLRELANLLLSTSTLGAGGAVLGAGNALLGNYSDPMKAMPGALKYLTSGETSWEGIDAYVQDSLKDNPEALATWNFLDDDAKEQLIEKSYSERVKNIGNLWGALSKDTQYDVGGLLEDLEDSIANWYTVKPTEEDATKYVMEGNDARTNAYLDELQAAEDRQTQLYKDQLQENQMMFDDYRSQILGNQYRQNAQLMGTVESAMDKSRRNALEAGASAGLRMAENINTTLAMQNKQAQTSLETSNQLAQQLLNQRQAAAGIRSDYNQMLSDNAYERRNYREDAIDRVHDANMSEYRNKITNMSNDTNPTTKFYSSYLQSPKNKAKSQYTGGQ